MPLHPLSCISQKSDLRVLCKYVSIGKITLNRVCLKKWNNKDDRIQSGPWWWSLMGRMSLSSFIQISIRDYQSRFIAAVVFPCFNTQAIDVCWGKIALIIFHPYVINRDLPLNARSAGPLNTHPSLRSVRTQTSSLRLIHGWLLSNLAWEYGIWNCIKPLQLLFF